MSEPIAKRTRRAQRKAKIADAVVGGLVNAFVPPAPAPAPVVNLTESDSEGGDDDDVVVVERKADDFVAEHAAARERVTELERELGAAKLHEREMRRKVAERAGGGYIYVKTLTGKTISVSYAGPGMTVGDLCAAIQDADGTPPDQQRLIFAGSIISQGGGNCYARLLNIPVDREGNTVSVGVGDTVFLVLRLRGC